MGVHAVDYITSTQHTPLPSPTARAGLGPLSIRAGGSSATDSGDETDATAVRMPVAAGSVFHAGCWLACAQPLVQQAMPPAAQQR